MAQPPRLDLDAVDRDLIEAEQQASPQRYRQRASDEIERVASASSASTTSSSGGSRTASARRALAMSRLSTQRDLERHPTELDRIQTARSQHSTTVGRTVTSRTPKRPLPGFGAGKPLPPPLPAQEEYVVEFDGPDDPLHAQNWPLRKKLLTAAMLGYTTMTAAFASSIFSAATRAIAAEFNVSTEVGILGVSFFVLGFAFGYVFVRPFALPPATSCARRC